MFPGYVFFFQLCWRLYIESGLAKKLRIACVFRHPLVHRWCGIGVNRCRMSRPLSHFDTLLLIPLRISCLTTLTPGNAMQSSPKFDLDTAKSLQRRVKSLTSLDSVQVRVDKKCSPRVTQVKMIQFVELITCLDPIYS